MKLWRVCGLAVLLLGAAMWGLGEREGHASGVTDAPAIAEVEAEADAVIAEAIVVETEPITSGAISSKLAFRALVETEESVAIYPSGWPTCKPDPEG